MNLLMPVPVFLLLLLLQGRSFAQQCNLNRDRDPYTKEIKLSSGFIELDGASVTIDANKDEIDFLFSMEQNNRCFDDNTTAQVFFDSSKTKLSIHNNGSMNCKGIFHFIFKNSATTPSQLARLSGFKVNHIDLYNNLDMTKKIGTINFTSSMQNTFMSLTACVATEAKTLRL